MKNSLYVYQNGELKRKDNTLQFCTVDGEKRDIPVNMISEIYLFGEVSINSKLIDFLSHNDIIVLQCKFDAKKIKSFWESNS